MNSIEIDMLLRVANHCMSLSMLVRSTQLGLNKSSIPNDVDAWNHALEHFNGTEQSLMMGLTDFVEYVKRGMPS